MKKNTYFDPVPDPDLEIRGGGGGGRSSRPLEKRGGGLRNVFFSALRASVWSKNKGTAGSPSIRHCDQHCYSLFRIRAFSVPFLSSPRAYKL